MNEERKKLIQRKMVKQIEDQRDFLPTPHYPCLINIA